MKQRPSASFFIQQRSAYSLLHSRFRMNLFITVKIPFPQLQWLQCSISPAEKGRIWSVVWLIPYF
jgi:hypothetical protein